MEENNKIIVEFLGWEKIYPEGYVEYILPKSLADPIYKLDSRFILEFDTDWNWLMEVVEKIESIKEPYHGRFGVYISSNSCTIQSTNFRPDKPIPNPPHYYDNVVLNSKMESTYNAVIRFINFYNKQKEE